MRRVVITGLGIVSCLGNNQEEVHQSLLNSKSGISYSEEYKEHNLKSHVHGKPNIKLEDHIERKTKRFMGTTGGLANGMVLADNKKIYSAESLKVGLFK
jgi:3-oxoacyl-[acyl-carrier-protein] synthase-1